MDGKGLERENPGKVSPGGTKVSHVGLQCARKSDGVEKTI